MKVVTKEHQTDHPLEDIFDIEPCTTIAEYKEVVPSEIVESPLYDDKDVEIETKLEEIYTHAMGTVEITSDEIEKVEGKYKARLGEVTASMLNVALTAVREKRELKQHKDKLRAVGGAGTGGGDKTVNNNLIVADRNEILQILRKQNQSD